MSLKRIMVLFTASCLILGSLAGCGSAAAETSGEDKGAAAQESTAEINQTSNLNPEGFPIVNEPITLEVFGQQGPVQGKWDEMDLWIEYQKMTNINLDFTNVLTAEGFDEKKNLMWASNDYPDIFVRAQLNNSELVKYGSIGVLEPLEDLIDQYAPNFKALMEKYPAIAARITAPDGHIYSLPAVLEVDGARTTKYWLNKRLLDEVGKDVPETLDEFEDMLKAFKGKDINQNGEADDYPMGVSDGQSLIKDFAGVWGHALQFGDQYLEVNDGKVETFLTDDSFKDELQWLNKIYEEGLVDPEIFTQEYAKFAAKMAGHNMGFFFNLADDPFDSTDYIGIAPFKGKADRQYCISAPIARDNGCFAISSECEYKEAAMRWIDYFYSDEGSYLMRYGVEGKTWTRNAEGKPEYMDNILNNPDGATSVIGKITIWPGGGAPQYMTEDNCIATVSETTMEAQKALDPYVPENIYAAPMFSQEVDERLVVLETDLNNYLKEATAKFIIGELPFEEWDTYVETLNKIGLEEWVSIYQDAFDLLNK